MVGGAEVCSQLLPLSVYEGHLICLLLVLFKIDLYPIRIG